MIQVSGLELGGVGLSGSATKMLEFLHATTNSFIRKLSPVIVKHMEWRKEELRYCLIGFNKDRGSDACDVGVTTGFNKFLLFISG